MLQKQAVGTDRTSELCPPCYSVNTDMSDDFVVFQSRSRLQPDGYPCNHSSNSIWSIMERHSLSDSLLGN